MTEDATNALIEQLASKLTAEGKEVLSEIQRAADAGLPPEEVADKALTLSLADQGILMKIFEHKVRAHQAEINEAQKVQANASLAMAVIEQAQVLDPSIGEHTSLKGAIEVLERHGEKIPEGLDTNMPMKVPVIEKIEHKKVSIFGGKREDGSFWMSCREHDVHIDALEAYYEYALLTAAAATYNMTGSLNKTASLLDLSGFQPPAGYEAEDGKYVYFGGDALPFWVEENRGRIMALVDSVPAKTVAAGDFYEDR